MLRRTLPLAVSVALLICASSAANADWKPIPAPTASKSDAAASTWLRCFVRVPDNMVTPQEKDLYRDSITFSVGGVRGPFALFVNGQKFAEGTGVADGQRKRFKVPKGILEKKAFNVFAIRLDGDAAKSGLGMPPILAGYFDELVLDGAWEISASQPDDASLKAVTTQPAAAFYTEAGFHQSSTPLSATDAIPGAKLPPQESLAKMTTPDDLRVDLVLAEPQVAQPTHVSFDERGRMWVAEYRQYPYPAGVKQISRDKYYRARFDRVPPPPPNHDRGRDIISVHEDTDGDGIFDKSKVVLDGLNMANAALRGHGGIWVMHTPYLLFYPDANGDDVPDRDPEVRLAGFGLEDTHSVANGLAWGPDGWIYGAQGSTTTSRIVRPGVDPEGFAGVYFEGCMVWRYHPERKIYEIFATGGGNTFELDFDSEGRLHSGHNGGETRGWHFVQNGQFLKQGVDPGKFGPPANPFAFGHLEAMKSRNPIQRFTHATIIADGSALPQHYAGRIFAADPLHRNVVISERYSRGSTFETSDSAVALAGADPSFRPVYITNAPDGAIYVADFCEEFIAHGQHYQGQVDSDSGRIFRIRGKETPLNKDIDLSKKSGAQLVDLLQHPNRWHRQTAVRLLAERHDAATIPLLKSALRKPAEHPALEALWALHQLGELGETEALAALAHPEAPVRMWAVRLKGDAKKLPERFFNATLRSIVNEIDPEVRSQIASTARNLPAAQAMPLVAALLQHEEDAGDPYIPMLCWWAIEAHCATDLDTVLETLPWGAKLTTSQIVQRLMRRFATAGTYADLQVCAKLLRAAPGELDRALMIVGFEESFRGRALPPLPPELVETIASTRMGSPFFRVRLHDPAAVANALRVVQDEKQKIDDRLLCVRLFGEVKTPDAVPVLVALVTSQSSLELRRAALTSLLLYDDRSIGEQVAAAYSQLPPELHAAAQTLLTSRPEWSREFLALVEKGTVAKNTVPPATAALLTESSDANVAALAAKLFPKPTATAKPAVRAEIDRIRALIAAAPGDPYKGEATFLQRCSACHTLFHKGGRIGPDLTPYQRDDLGTLLTSVLDPSAEIREGFVNQLLTTKDGRTLSGFVTTKDAAVVVLRGLDGQDVSIPREEIRELKPSPASIMPEGLLLGLSDQELRDFFAYLRIPQPITR